MKLIKTILLALCLTAITTSCNDNDPNYESTPLTSLVTYDMTIASGDNDISKDIAYFTFYTDDNNSAPITYTATGMTRKIEAQPGSRMLIAYYLNGQAMGQSGSITLITYRTVPGGTVEIKPTDEAQAANAPIPVSAINRTGNYINLFVRMMNNPDRTFTMIADQATVGTETVDMYVTTAVPSSGDTGIINEQVASFDMTAIWRNPTTMKVRVHVNNTAGTQNVFEFSK